MSSTAARDDDVGVGDEAATNATKKPYLMGNMMCFLGQKLSEHKYYNLIVILEKTNIIQYVLACHPLCRMSQKHFEALVLLFVIN